MKAIVISCRNITQDSENFNSTNEKEDELARLKDEMSDKLGVLMNAAKSFATSSGRPNPDPVLKAKDSLAIIVFDLLDLVNGSGNSKKISLDELKVFPK